MSQTILNKVQSYIKEENLFPPKTPLLVACSGGPDSLAAVKVLIALGYKVGIAHCNFKLRGENSDGDQAFVETFANENKIPFTTISFNTEIVAFKNRMSIQEAARKLRYTWLEEVRQSSKFHFIVTAHHKDDVAETVLLNMSSGTGIKGMKGIPVKNGKIVRPLLSVSKEEILDYLSENKIDYRKDESNNSTKYTRNFIRHEVIPALEKVNEKASEHLYNWSKKAKEAEVLMQERITQIKRKIVSKKYNADELKFGYVLQHASGRTILYELLKAYGFNTHQAQEVYDNLESKSGIEFLSKTHRIIKDRKSLFIMPLHGLLEQTIAIQKFDKIPNQIVFNNYKIQVDKLPIAKCVVKKSSNYAYLDFTKIDLPLTIRYWEAGDYFYPLGLTKRNSDKVGKKKLSKYFKDEKVSIYEKENTAVLFSGEKLIWLVGQRIDDRFKVTDETKEVLKLKIIKN